MTRLISELLTGLMVAGLLFLLSGCVGKDCNNPEGWCFPTIVSPF